ncbi:MAG: hypothetical protein LBP28_04630 [Coriobacteriales bacterium]|nr:hypothetical protein [Coriobacteriales bacterium]
MAAACGGRSGAAAAARNNCDTLAAAARNNCDTLAAAPAAPPAASCHGTQRNRTSATHRC